MHAVVLVAVSLFVVAGLWQLHRLEERRATNALVGQRRAMPAITDLDDVQVHRRARLEGRYDVDEEIVLRGRGGTGRSGNHVLTPLQTNDGAIVVDRGWVPVELDDPPVTPARPPDDDLRVEGLLLPTEGNAPFTGGGSNEMESMSRIDLARIAGQLPYEIAPVYLLLEQQDPAQSQLPDPVEPAELSEGSHLAYAVQWFSFIPIALVVYGAIMRREARKRAGQYPGTAGGGEASPSKTPAS